MDDAFVQAYFSIDEDGAGEISKDELVAYAAKNNYDDKFVGKWLKLFDRKDSGVITIAEFCDVLGLEMAKIKEQHQQHIQAHKNSLPDGLIILSSDMEEELQCSVWGIVKEGHEKHDQMKDVAKFIKGALDARLNPLWHCVIVQGQYWAFYSFEPGYSFVFKFGKYVYLIWRTPTV